MANDDTPSGFLSRWSRRKAEVREGRALDEPASLAHSAVIVRAVPQPSAAAPTNAVIPSPLSSGDPRQAVVQADAPKPAAPTLADVEQLTFESNYANFMARDVAPDVKNAAMKKLFSDPHFNVMDRLDIYIDDYGIPDPLPAAMLRQMTSAKFLNLFDDEPEPTDNPSPTDSPTHDHADLRLQPDPAPRPESSEPKPL